MRSLYQCANAKVREGNETTLGEIYCAKGHQFSGNYYRTLSRGNPLELTTCQKCSDYDEMGEPVKAEDRGWVGKKTT